MVEHDGCNRQPVCPRHHHDVLNDADDNDDDDDDVLNHDEMNRGAGAMASPTDIPPCIVTQLLTADTTRKQCSHTADRLRCPLAL